MSQPIPRLLTVTLFVLLVFGFTPGLVAAQTDDTAAIRKLVEQFFSAYAKEDIEGLMSLWSQDSTELTTSKQSFQKSFSDLNNIQVKNLDIRKVTIEADKATLRLQMEVSALDAKTGKPVDSLRKENRTLRLVKQRGDWKVSQYVVTENELAVAMLAAKTTAERRALFDADKDLQTTALVIALRKQDRFSRQELFSQALPIYQVALEVAEWIDDKKSRAVITQILGLIHFSQGNFAEALGFYEKSVALYEAVGDKTEIPDLLNYMGQVHAARGSYPEAQILFRKNLALAEEMGDKRKVAFALNTIGAFFSIQGDYLQGVEYYRRSLAISEELNDADLMISPLSNLGSTYRLLGNNVLALEYYQKSLKLSEAINDRKRIANTLANIGEIHLSQANYSQALEYLRRALELAESAGFKPDVVGFEHIVGNVHLVRRDYALALAHYEKSLSMSEALGQKMPTAFTLQSIGNVHLLQGNTARALDYFQRSLVMAEQLGDTLGIAGAQIGYSNVYLAQGDYAKALEAAERGLAAGSQMQKPDVLWMSHNLIGRSQRALGMLESARQSFTEAIKIIEEMRAGVAGGEEDKQRFFQDKLNPYHSMVELLIKNRNFNDALIYAERAKARTLLDVLSSGRVNVTKAMTKEEQEREQALNAALVVINSQMREATQRRDTSSLAELKTKQEKARLEYEAFQINLYAAHPELKVQRGQSRLLSIDELDQLLNDDKTAILEYVVGEKDSYLFVITKAAGGGKRVTLKVYPLGINAKMLAAQSVSFRQKVADRDLSVKTPGRQLYDKIVKPAETQLRGVNKLIIVPDGVLWDLPFQALYRGERGYLLENFAISYAPSLSVLREMRSKGSTSASPPSAGRGAELLAVGNPDMNVEEMAKGSLLRDDDFVPLPGAEQEVNALGELYGRNRSKVLVGDKAAEEVIKNEAERYRLLHFATHAILDDRNPMYSRIILSRPKDKRQDGMLEAWELMKLDLTAEMVVLSACQTARGRIGAGEGMIGMSWALFVAGSPSVVVSQWKVDSDRTMELMIEFHQNLVRRQRGSKQPTTKAEALRAAALKLLHGKYNHPVYWAGFVLIGNER
ncbi:MAG TPA: CHAT domain-containing protein [Pyrinomonadaceae bacterium]|nr:CHAT domain-containing protein [Pyrinomonadaceae bacterium]